MALRSRSRYSVLGLGTTKNQVDHGCAKPMICWNKILIHDFPLTHFWFIHDFPLTHFWFIRDFPLTPFWFIHDFPLTHFWFIHDFPLTHFWFIHDFPLTHFWFIHDFPLTHFWFIHDFPLTYFWFIRDFPLTHFWFIHALPYNPRLDEVHFTTGSERFCWISLDISSYPFNFSISEKFTKFSSWASPKKLDRAAYGGLYFQIRRTIETKFQTSQVQRVLCKNWSSHV